MVFKKCRYKIKEIFMEKTGVEKYSYLNALKDLLFRGYGLIALAVVLVLAIVLNFTYKEKLVNEEFIPYEKELNGMPIDDAIDFMYAKYNEPGSSDIAQEYIAIMVEAMKKTGGDIAARMNPTEANQKDLLTQEEYDAEMRRFDEANEAIKNLHDPEEFEKEGMLRSIYWYIWNNSEFRKSQGADKYIYRQPYNVLFGNRYLEFDDNIHVTGEHMTDILPLAITIEVLMAGLTWNFVRKRKDHVALLDEGAAKSYRRNQVFALTTVGIIMAAILGIGQVVRAASIYGNIFENERLVNLLSGRYSSTLYVGIGLMIINTIIYYFFRSSLYAKRTSRWSLALYIIAFVVLTAAGTYLFFNIPNVTWYGMTTIAFSEKSFTKNIVYVLMLILAAVNFYKFTTGKNLIFKRKKVETNNVEINDEKEIV